MPCNVRRLGSSASSPAPLAAELLLGFGVVPHVTARRSWCETDTPLRAPVWQRHFRGPPPPCQHVCRSSSSRTSRSFSRHSLSILFQPLDAEEQPLDWLVMRSSAPRTSHGLFAISSCSMGICGGSPQFQLCMLDLNQIGAGHDVLRSAHHNRRPGARGLFVGLAGGHLPSVLPTSAAC